MPKAILEVGFSQICVKRNCNGLDDCILAVVCFEISCRKRSYPFDMEYFLYGHQFLQNNFFLRRTMNSLRKGLNYFIFFLFLKFLIFVFLINLGVLFLFYLFYYFLFIFHNLVYLVTALHFFYCHSFAKAFLICRLRIQVVIFLFWL